MLRYLNITKYLSCTKIQAMNLIHSKDSLHVSALIEHLVINMFDKLSQAQHIQSVLRISGKIVKHECVKCPSELGLLT